MALHLAGTETRATGAVSGYTAFDLAHSFAMEWLRIKGPEPCRPFSALA